MIVQRHYLFWRRPTSIQQVLNTQNRSSLYPSLYLSLYLSEGRENVAIVDF